ncbi:unnamed protein product [Closterium sp. Yama58-4]|nr:unnamed protein product [Closterium sp. Yama58-4]
MVIAVARRHTSSTSITRPFDIVVRRFITPSRMDEQTQPKAALQPDAEVPDDDAATINHNNKRLGAKVVHAYDWSLEALKAGPGGGSRGRRKLDSASSSSPGASGGVGVAVGAPSDTSGPQPGGGGGSGGRGVVTCRVDGCGEDLSSARSYNRRHRVCGVHTRAAAVTVDGNQQRFCQQCSRFQDMDDFEPGRRSCRQSLQYHNKRRRKADLKTLRSPQLGSGSAEEGHAKRGPEGRRTASLGGGGGWRGEEPRHGATGSSSDNSGDLRVACYSRAGQPGQPGQAGQATQAEEDQQCRRDSMQVALASADLVLSQVQNRPAEAAAAAAAAAAAGAAAATASPSASAAAILGQREHLSSQPQNQGSPLQFPLQPLQQQRSMSSGSTGYGSSPSFDQAERQRTGRGSRLDPHQPLQPLQGQLTLSFQQQHQNLPQLSPPPRVQQPKAHESHAVGCDMSAFSAAADAGAAGADADGGAGGYGGVGTAGGAAAGGMNGEGQGAEGRGCGERGAEGCEEALTGGELRELEHLDFAPWPGGYGGFGGADLGDS